MLADQGFGLNPNLNDGDDFPKRQSMLKKTMKVIGKVGKVTPKFKGGKSKKNKQMELFDSCSFEFDMDDPDADGSEAQGNEGSVSRLQKIDDDEEEENEKEDGTGSTDGLSESFKNIQKEETDVPTVLSNAFARSTKQPGEHENGEDSPQTTSTNEHVVQRRLPTSQQENSGDSLLPCSTNKRCSACGSICSLPEGARFCPHCGCSLIMETGSTDGLSESFTNFQKEKTVIPTVPSNALARSTKQPGEHENGEDSPQTTSANEHVVQRRLPTSQQENSGDSLLPCSTNKDASHDPQSPRKSGHGRKPRSQESNADSPQTTPANQPVVQQNMLKGPSMMNINSIVEESSTSKDATTSPRKSGHSRKSRSPVPKKGKVPSNPKKSSNVSPDSKKRDVVSKSKPEKFSPKTQSSQRLSSEDLNASTLSLGLPEHVSGQANEDNDDSFLRCSEVFRNDSALGGYFSKVQGLKGKDDKNKSAVVGDADGNDEENKHVESPKTPQHNSKSQGRVKLFFKTNRTSPKESGGNFESTKASSDASKDEAALLMEELSNMLQPTIERPSPKKSSRKVRTIDYDEEGTSEEFPEIPTEKKTSLSDIRRMMDACKTESAGTPIRAHGVATHDPLWRRTSKGRISNDKVLSNSEKSSGPSPIDEAPANPQVQRPRRRMSRHSGVNKKTISDLPVQPDLPPPSSTENETQSPRKHKARASNRTSAKPSSSNEVNGSSKDSELQIDGSDKHTTSEKHAGHRRRRGNRRSETSNTITQEASISEKDGIAQPATVETPVNSPGRFRSRQSQNQSDAMTTPEGSASTRISGQADEIEDIPNLQLANSNSNSNEEDAISTPPETIPSSSVRPRSRRSQRRINDKMPSDGSFNKPCKVDATPFATRRSRPRPSDKRNDLRSYTVRSFSTGSVLDPNRSTSEELKGVSENDMEVTIEDQVGDNASATKEEHALGSKDLRSHNSRSLSTSNVQKSQEEYLPNRKSRSQRGMCENKTVPDSDTVRGSRVEKKSGGKRNTSASPKKLTTESNDPPRKSRSGQVLVGIPENGDTAHALLSGKEDESKEQPIDKKEPKAYSKHQSVEQPREVSGKETIANSKPVSLAESLEKRPSARLRLFDEQSVAETISTDGGSEMFVKGHVSFSCFKSSDKLSAPQLIFGSNDAGSESLQVKNA